VREVGLVVHGGRPRAVEVAREIGDRLRAHGIAVREFGEDEEGGPAGAAAEGARGLDLIVSVGGDGTLLRAARLARDEGTPLLAVNVGRVGFLTEVGPEQALEALDEAIAGSVILEDRLALVAEPHGAPWREPQWALNEIIVEKKARHRLVTVSCSVDGVPLTTFSADGVIVSTPTGSTAYSFSARGPIVSPRVACLLVTPVAPHMLFDRPVALAPDEAVELEVVGDEPGLLSADGTPSLDLPVGSRVVVRASERPVRLVRRASTPSFVAVLREKFRLPAGQAPHVAAPPADPASA
jgi:NAD+ kinase